MFKVFIDPGHGHPDSGAVGPSGVQEKDLNMQFAELLSLACRRKGWDVMWSRSGDFNVSERASAQKANAWNADVYVSLHCNGSYNPQAKGYEVLYWHSSNRGKALAEGVLDLMQESYACRDGIGVNRGAKPKQPGDRGATVLSQTVMPAIIVESGFVTNVREEQWLQKFSNQAIVVEAIVKTIDNVFKGGD